MIRVTVKNNTKLPRGKVITDAIVKKVAYFTIKLQGLVKTTKLSGQVLKRKTGTLSRSINTKFENNGLVGKVGTNVLYGKVWEYGGVYQIKAHMRMMKQAFGKPVSDPRLINVQAHAVRFPEKSFLRSALKDLRPEIKPGFQKAIKDVLKTR